MNLKGLYFITDRKLSKKSVEKTVQDAIAGGTKVIQYREKEQPTRQMLRVAENIRDMTRESDVIFLINDRIDIALAVDADGVHLGQDDMPIKVARGLLGTDKIIGLTAHNVKEAKESQAKGADYVGVSPIFATDTKPDAGEPAGLGLIRDVKATVTIPQVAIGGITDENLQSVIDAGADSVCMISAVVTKDDIVQAVRNVNTRFGI